MEVSDPNTYKIVSERYTRYFDAEKKIIHKGALLDNMKNLFDTVKRRQGPNLIRLTLEHKDGTIIESYP